MLENIKDGDLVITSPSLKAKILKEISLKKEILNVKFMSLNEFCADYFGTYDPLALYFLMKKYNLKYDVALRYLNNIFFKLDELKVYYDDLISNNLIFRNELFKDSLNNIVIINNIVDPYIKKELDKYNTRYINFDNKNFKPSVYEFNNQTDEIVFVASEIVKKLKTVDINDIFLLELSDEYKDEVRRIFKLFNLPINVDTYKSIYGSDVAQTFLLNLYKYKNVNKALEGLNQNEIYNNILDILNKYAGIKEVDEVFCELIKCEIKNTSIKKDYFKNAINVCSFSDLEDDKYYYLLGFNQGNYPKLFKDDNFISDKKKKALGLFTSLEKFKNSKKFIASAISSFRNITISYKLRNNYNIFYPANLIDELKLEVNKNYKVQPLYSNAYNKEHLAKLLDNFYKFNESSLDLKRLYKSYQIPYLTYDNSYSGGNFESLNKYLKGKFNLSYSSMNNYFLCAFRFYCANVLKLDSFEESFMTMVGTLFHLCLSNMYKDDFDLRKIYDDYLDDKVLSHKEKFFINKLYNDLEFAVSVIRKQEEYSVFDKVNCEKFITVEKSSKLQINFVGIVDKIRSVEFDGKTLVAIIDYKTGFVETKLDNINYGLHLQLPVYIYLTKNGMHKNVQIVGFYLQKILNSVALDSDDYEKQMKKNLKLDGYTVADENLIGLFDKTYNNSMVIKGMGTTSKGFRSYAKVISNDGIEKVSDLVDEKINEVIDNLERVNFPINPKRIDNKLVGCEFCPFSDLCFKKEEDIINLKKVSFSEIVGDNNA